MKKTLALSIALAVLLAGCTTQTPAPVQDTTIAQSTTAVPTSAPPATTATAPAEPEVVDFAFTPENMPRMDGSTATRPLAAALASTLMGLDAEDAETYAQFTGTSSAYKRLAEQEVDLLVVYEPQLELLEELGGSFTFEMAPIGRDALVFLVNAQNPVDSLTHEQIVDIYSGDITNWREVGGESADIRAFQRNHSSGSQTLMDKLVMDGAPLDTPPYDYVIGEMAGLVSAVAAYDGGAQSMGYNVHYFVSQMVPNPNIKLLAVGGVAPQSDTIRTGEYPFVNDFYAVILRDAEAGTPQRILYNWLQGEAGQGLIEAAGYVSVTGGQ